MAKHSQLQQKKALFSAIGAVIFIMIAIYLSYKPLREAICYNGGFCHKTCDKQIIGQNEVFTCPEIEQRKNEEFFSILLIKSFKYSILLYDGTIIEKFIKIILHLCQKIF